MIRHALISLHWHWNHWKPFVRGNDGLTGRERRAYVREYARTIGRMR